MTTTTKVSANGRAGYPGARLGTALPTRQKRPGYIALALGLIVSLAAIGGYWYSQAGQKTAVVVVVRDVPAGHVITRSDLSTVAVAGAVTAIGAARIGSVVGEVATVELLPNTLLQRAMVTSAAPLPADEAMVGVAVSPGQLPSDRLRDGATVQVLALPDKNAAASGGTSGAAAGAGPAATVLAGRATVYSSSPDPSQTGGTLLTLIVPITASAAVAAASSAGLVALVQVGP